MPKRPVKTSAKRPPAGPDADRKRPKRGCKGLNKKGEPCGAIPFKPGSVVDGVTVSGDWCRRHSVEANELPASASLRSAHAAAVADGRVTGRPRSPRPADVMRARLEEWAEEQLEETLRALGGALAAERAVVVGTGEFAELELVPDHDVRLKAVREIYDRALGKPVATNLIGGADTGPVEVDVPTTADRIKEVAEVLRDLGLEDV